MINIRLMETDDYEKVYNLWINTSGMGLNSTDDSREGIEKYLRRNPTTCFVAQCGKNIVGAIMAGHDGRRGYIYHTAVLPEYRRNGLAGVLVNKAVEALAKEGINKAALVVFERNEIGNSFWEKVGFSEREDLVYRNKLINPINRIDT